MKILEYECMMHFLVIRHSAVTARGCSPQWPLSQGTPASPPVHMSPPDRRGTGSVGNGWPRCMGGAKEGGCPCHGRPERSSRRGLGEELLWQSNPAAPSQKPDRLTRFDSPFNN